jgi:CBS domain-containing protein
VPIREHFRAFTKVVSVQPHSKAIDAFSLMWSKGLGGVAVIDSQVRVLPFTPANVCSNHECELIMIVRTVGVLRWWYEQKRLVANLSSTDLECLYRKQFFRLFMPVVDYIKAVYTDKREVRLIKA